MSLSPRRILIGFVCVLAPATTVALVSSGCRDQTPPVPEAASSDAMEVRYTVRGMTCEQCEHAVHDALKRVPGVVDCTASFEREELVVRMRRDADADTVLSAVAGLGFTIERAN